MSVVLATEDALSEAVGLRLLHEHAVFVQTPPMTLRKGGFGYLRSRMESWKQMAQHRLVMLLTDQDRVACPVQLLEDWLGPGGRCPENLLFRIAEREVESWLLADHEAMSQLIGRKVKFPLAPDVLPDPKQSLIELAKKAPRVIRDDLVAERGAMAKQGLGYNARLMGWVKTAWCPQRAAERSPSLARTRRALSRTAVLLKQEGCNP